MPRQPITLNLSRTFSDIISASNEPITCLDGPAFIQLFNEIINQYHIIEFYLLDNHGSFLLLDENAKPVWLLIKDDETLNDLAEFAELSGAGKIADMLTSRNNIPYFYSKEDFSTGPAMWDKYMHSAKVLEGKKRYFYSILTDTPLYSLEKNNIVSYKEFLKTAN